VTKIPDYPQTPLDSEAEMLAALARHGIALRDDDPIAIAEHDHSG